MKEVYPDYQKSKTQPIFDKLSILEKEVINNFLTFCRATSNEYKVSCRKTEIIQIRDIMEKDFDKWKNEDIVKFVAILNSSNRSVWTKKGILVTLGMFLKWKHEDWSKRFKNLEIIKKLQKNLVADNEDKYKDPPTPQEIDSLIRCANTTKNKLYISMCSEAGLPPAVQLNLKFENFKIDSPKTNITTLQYHRGKNDTSFIFPLGKITTHYLKMWKQEYCFPNVREDDYLFPSPKDRTKPMSSVNMWRMWKRVSQKAGIMKNIYQYKLRHETLSNSYDIFTEEVHRKLFGHVKGSNMTKTYSHKKDKEKTLAIALEKLHNVDKVTTKEEKSLREEIKLLKKQHKELENHLIMAMDKIDLKGSELSNDELVEVIGGYSKGGWNGVLQQAIKMRDK